jgi:hypothetical protein
MKSMLFTNPRTNQSYIYGNVQIQNKNITLMPQQLNNVRQIITNSAEPVVPEAPKELKRPKSMKWGEPTWFFFHTIAEKVKEEKFDSIRKELLNLVYSICANLPCPDCASHASEYMRGINFNAIKTKQHLKDLFFNFHNAVNEKKGFEKFPYDKLDEKYSKAIFVNIVQNFLIHFQNKHSSIHMIANDLHRNRVVEQIKSWLQENIVHFNP